LTKITKCLNITKKKNAKQKTRRRTMNVRKTKEKKFKDLCREQIVVRVPFETRRFLEQKAKERGLSLSELVRSYLEKSLLEEIKCEKV
jgi:predicted HicB family RNase H-like nuclease